MNWNHFFEGYIFNYQHQFKESGIKPLVTFILVSLVNYYDETANYLNKFTVKEMQKYFILMDLILNRKWIRISTLIEFSVIVYK